MDTHVTELKTEPTGMKAVLLYANRTLETLWLPRRPEGRFRFVLSATGAEFPSFYIEGANGRWFACCSAPCVFTNCSDQEQHRTVLGDSTFLTIQDGKMEHFLYMEACNTYSNLFQNFRICGTQPLTIGRTPDNDIAYCLACGSGSHAALYPEGNGMWRLEDRSSKNGTYVNGIRTQMQRLRPGDVIAVMGMRIIMGVGFLAVNNVGREVYLNTNRLALLSSGGGSAPPENAAAAGTYFNRAPRQRMSMDAKPIDIEGPPMSMKNGQMPLLLRMGSSMVMGGASLLAGNVTMVLSSVLFPLLSSRYTDKERKEYEQRRDTLYRKYLAQKEMEIRHECEQEEYLLNTNDPELRVVLQFPQDRERLWERQRTDDDFLHVRIGVGNRPMLAEIRYPEQRFSMDDDPLEQQMYALAGKQVFLERVPILTALDEQFISGIVGGHTLVRTFLRQLLMQLAVLHSCEDVKIILLCSETELNWFEDMRDLPHFWNDQRDFRFLATTEAEVYQIGEYLKNELLGDLEKPRPLPEILRERPYYVLIAKNKTLFDGMGILKEVLRAERSCGISILTAFDDLPKECRQVFRLNAAGEHAVHYPKQPERPFDYFQFDTVEPAAMQACLRRLANVGVRVEKAGYTLPKMLTFLEMFGVGRVEHLNAAKRWAENGTVKSLAAPVGVGANGALFSLDLHEKYQGPHGLVAGMTGSGKSEFLLTYILSMAVQYHPDDVAFVLIDYKGGGLAGAFDDTERGIRLPHLVGTITNLDGSTIQRSLISLQSELTRRQRIFNAAKRLSDEGTMDISLYQRLYHNGCVDEPLPHLFLISDEFAELKQQQPEFMDKLISIARIGRSLGVHLILATQKPAGVVNDQIRSNTKFRVCLKVQDRNDSMDMLKRPEAAELKETGRFYLQVGYNEFFALGQSAWSGAPYEPQDEVHVQRDDAIQFIDPLGRTVLAVKPKEAPKRMCGSQLTAVVQMLSALAAHLNLPQHNLWMPELPEKLDCADKRLHLDPGDGRGGVLVCPGLLDDPENQRQFPLKLDLQQCQHLLITGSSGSGKSMLLQSMLFSLVRDYSPGQLQFYVLDYSSGMLRLFQKLPHCAAVLTEDDNAALDVFFDTVRKLVTARKRLFAELEVDSFEAARAVRELPLVLIVIDNVPLLGASKNGEKHLYALSDYLKESAAYGVKYILTCSGLNEVQTRTRQAIGTRLCLHMKDKYDYGEALGCKVQYVPPDQPGRGLFCIGERALELQCAMYRCELESSARLQALKAELEQITKRYSKQDAAPALQIASETATYEMFLQQFAKGRIPLGYSGREHKPVALPLRQLTTLSIYFGNPASTVPVTQNLLQAALRECMDVWFFKCRSESVLGDLDIPEEHIRVLGTDNASLTALWQELAAEFGRRKTVLEQVAEQEGVPEGDGAEAFRLLQTHTRPVLLWIESMEEFSSGADGMTSLMFSRLFQAGPQRNVYTAACFAPNHTSDEDAGVLYQNFSLSGDALLFGGQYARQNLCDIPDSAQGATQMLPLNRCLMRYRGGVYPLVMPCGELNEEPVDEDAQSIF